MNNKYKANPSSRLVATLIDFLICFLLYTLLASFIVNPIIAHTDDYQNNYNTYEKILLDSHLVLKNENDQLYYFINNYDNSKYQEYDQVFISFYNIYDASGEKANEYLENQKKQDKIFTFDEATNTVSLCKDDDGKDVSAQSFYTSALSDAVKYLYETDTTYANSYKKVNFYVNLSKYTSIVISLLLVFLLVPMIFKNGETLGKKIFSLRLGAISDNVEPVKKWQILVRFAIISLEVIGSLILYGLPLIVSMLMMMFTKSNFAIHDYAARTLVLDNKLIIKEEQLPTSNSNDVIEAEAVEKETVEPTENNSEPVVEDSDVNK